VVEILENTREVKDKFHRMGWGGDENELTLEHIEALKNGKALALNDGEYTHIFTLEKVNK
jgi:hypothetical protein